MAKFKISGNAIEFNGLILCIGLCSGTPGQNRAKNLFLDRVFVTWPELNKDNEGTERLDDTNPEAFKARELEMDTEEQGALAETFLAAVKPQTTGARFRLFTNAAKLIQVTKWWDKQTTEKLVPFKHGDNAQEYSDNPAPASA